MSVGGLLAFSIAPSATVLNQLLAMLLWGVVLTLFAVPTMAQSVRATSSLALAGVLFAIGGLAAWGLQVVPASLAAPTILVTLAAVMLAMAASADAQLRGESTQLSVAIGLVVLGALNVLIAIVQVFFPDAADGIVMARSGLVGRAVGNLRQPNHLSSLALWSAAAVVPLLEGRRLRQGTAAALFAAIVFSVELSASRTGTIGVLVLAGWGLLDSRLSRFTRVMLVSSVAVYALGWLFMSWWAHANHHTFGAEARLGESDVSGSRFGIWSNTWTLIKANPWTGVGFGEFNFAWTLTPFPSRPTAFFDHTHNIVLQLLVELGLPLGGLIVVLLALALWQAFRRSAAVECERGVGFRTAFVMVLLMAIHSQLEYPLWYAYFLLPTAWFWGYCLGAAKGALADERAAPSATSRAMPVVAGALMIAGSAVAFQQYMSVSRIFEPESDKRPLEARIAEGERSIFFGHHAYYADATVTDPPQSAWPAFAVAPHYLLDTRLMVAWAQAFAGRGDLDRARHIAQRLREFHRPESDEFFAPCTAQEHATAAPLPWQCLPPSRTVDWREFRDPALWR